jgi:alpha-tubulin suppressor-like RCC1 family protein
VHLASRLRYVLNHSVLANGTSDLPAGSPAWNRFNGAGTLMANLALDEAKRIAGTQHLFATIWRQYLVVKADCTLQNLSARASPATPALTDVTKVSTAPTWGHAVALRKDGTVVAWGVPDRLAVPAGLSDVVDVAAGQTGTVALKRDGTVVGWGKVGGFVVGGRYDGSTPYTIPQGLTGIQSIFLGPANPSIEVAIALKQDGSIVAWERDGRLLGPPLLEETPGSTRLVRAPPVMNLMMVEPIEWGAVGLRTDGTVVAWIFDNFGSGPIRWVPPAGLKDVVSLATGDRHALALKRDGTVVAWAWGEPYDRENEWGQATVPAGLSGVVAITVSDKTSFALKADGTICQWGQSETTGRPLALGICSAE